MSRLDPYVAGPARYDAAAFRRCGHSGLALPPISLGLWHNFGDGSPFEVQRAIVRRAFDRGVTCFDLANNYGPPYGAAETNFGRLLREDLAPYRDELVITTKAGWDMWPGPYGDRGSRKYLVASLDQSLTRLGVDYVDIFYHHHYDDSTPLEETLGALDHAVRQGKALYVGISSYSPARTRSRFWADREAAGKESPTAARESAGTPARYLSVSRPWASGEKMAQPTPSSPSVSSSSSSIHRLSSEYEGWCTSSGVPRSCRMAAASRVRAGEYEEMPT